MTEKIVKIASDLSDLESPVRKARNLAWAIHMMASVDELRGEPGDAVFAVADSLVEILDAIEKTREETWRLALEARDHVQRRLAKIGARHCALLTSTAFPRA